MTPLILEGTLGEADHKTHVPLSFTVPAGTTRLVGRFTTSPQRSAGALFDNMVCLTVEGPGGVRGARHNNPGRDFSIDADRATPGYVAGPIEPGAWTVWLDCFRLIGPDRVAYRLELDFETAPLDAPSAAPAPVRPNRGAGWYKGDLHAHTLHSDGKWDLADLAAFARDRDLDFVTLTDHNTVSGLAAFERLGDDGLLTMGGVELTTHYGHALALGTRRWTEWRAKSKPGVVMPAIASAVYAAGNLFVIAHPRAPGDPSCTGCRWEYTDMMPGNARIVEIWNGPWSDYNEEGLALFHDWLDDGYRLAATAGTDIHGPYERADPQGFNHVEASALTEAAVLEAVQHGRNYLSSGPLLVVSGEDAAGRPVAMGGQLAAGTLKVAWAGAENLDLVVVADGERRRRGAVPDQGEAALALPERWLMVELRGPDGRLHAVTNPVFRG
jgi:hypothetical protein